MGWWVCCAKVKADSSPNCGTLAVASNDSYLADVISQLKSIIAYSDAQLTTEERNLLSIAYKNITGTLRASWRAVDQIEKHERMVPNVPRHELALLQRERERIENELANRCTELLKLLEKTLTPAASIGEERVFYHKMCAPSSSACFLLLLPRCIDERVAL